MNKICFYCRLKSTHFRFHILYFIVCYKLTVKVKASLKTYRSIVVRMGKFKKLMIPLFILL